MILVQLVRQRKLAGTRMSPICPTCASQWERVFRSLQPTALEIRAPTAYLSGTTGAVLPCRPHNCPALGTYEPRKQRTRDKNFLFVQIFTLRGWLLTSEAWCSRRLGRTEEESLHPIVQPLTRYKSPSFWENFFCISWKRQTMRTFPICPKQQK